MNIWDGIVKGEMLGRALRMILEWLEEHREELMENWVKAQNGEPLEKIEPLNKAAMFLEFVIFSNQLNFVSMKRLLFISGIVLGLSLNPSNSYAQLGGLLKKAKEKVKETVGSVTGEVKDNAQSNNGGVVGNVTQAARGEAPWPMASNSPSYNGKDFHEFLMGIADESDEYVISLRDQMFARLRQNASIIRANPSGSYEAQQENARFQAFYFEMSKMLNLCVSNAVSSNGALTPETAYFMVQSRKGGGVDGYFLMRKEGGGGYHFTNRAGEGAFLKGDALSQAKDSRERMKKWQLLSYQMHEVMKECGYEVDTSLRTIYNRSGMYANAMEQACNENSPENIDRKPRPAAGAMHASLKAQALAVAKAADSNVIDVIITSASWDVKMKGLVPVCRNVYGYFLVKDEQGIMCLSRMWTEDYQGNGKYGKLRVGGTGTASPFYIK